MVHGGHVVVVLGLNGNDMGPYFVGHGLEAFGGIALLEKDDAYTSTAGVVGHLGKVHGTNRDTFATHHELGYAIVSLHIAEGGMVDYEGEVGMTIGHMGEFGVEGVEVMYKGLELNIYAIGKLGGYGA